MTERLFCTLPAILKFSRVTTTCEFHMVYISDREKKIQLASLCKLGKNSEGKMFGNVAMGTWTLAQGQSQISFWSHEVEFY